MEGPLTVSSFSEVEPRVMCSAVVVSAEGQAVVEVGSTIPAPGEPVMVDLAPGEGALAAGHGAGVVNQGQGATLAAAVQAARATEVQGHRVAVEDGGDQPGVAGQAAGFAGGDCDPGVEPGGTEAGGECFEVERDQDLAAVAAVAGPALHGEVFDAARTTLRRWVS